MTPKRLGRGLGALIREATDETVTADSILRVPVSLVSPNPQQPRQTFDEKSLQELADSIREKGIIQPITVRIRDEGYELIVGERRWRAAQIAGLTEIPAHILDVTSDEEMMEYALIENIQRDNLNIIEEAEAYAILSGKYGMLQSQIGKAVGKSRVAVSNTLRLLKLPPEIKRSLRKNEITAGHARALLGLKNSNQMITLWRRIVKRGESVRTTEELVAKFNEATVRMKLKKSVPKKRKSPEIRKIEDDLITLLGTKVTVNPRPNGGVIEVEYYSDSDLDRLMELFLQIDF